MVVGVVSNPARGAILLTFHDAQELVEHTPAFLKAQGKGYCPQSGGDASVHGATASFVIRGECKAMPFIGSFEVDMASGQVTDSTTSDRVETPMLAQVRAELFKARTEALITSAEASCLLKEVATSKEGSQCTPVRIFEATDSYFMGEVACDAGSLQKEHFRVDRSTGKVTNIGPTSPAMSVSAAKLMADLLTAHSRPMLTVGEAEQLVKSLWSADPSKRGGCLKIDRESGHNANDVWLQVRVPCDDENASVTRVVVDLVRGNVEDLGAGSVQDSPSSADLRKTLLVQAIRRVANARDLVSKTCGPDRVQP
jgi:hypothetical protein